MLCIIYIYIYIHKFYTVRIGKTCHNSTRGVMHSLVAVEKRLRSWNFAVQKAVKQSHRVSIDRDDRRPTTVHSIHGGRGSRGSTAWSPSPARSRGGTEIEEEDPLGLPLVASH